MYPARRHNSLDVAGDPKDRVRIRYRNELKNRHIADLQEAAQMFPENHTRSASELTVREGHEFTIASPPASSDVSWRFLEQQHSRPAFLAARHQTSHCSHHIRHYCIEIQQQKYISKRSISVSQCPSISTVSFCKAFDMDCLARCQMDKCWCTQLLIRPWDVKHV